MGIDDLLHQGVLRVQVEGAAAAVLPGRFVTPIVVAFQEEIAVAQTAKHLTDVGARAGLPPPVRDLRVPGLQTLGKSIADLGDQEVKGDVADALLVF